MAKGDAGKMAGTAVRLGVKYGPLVYGALKYAREPAQEAAQRFVSKKNARRRALAHARTLIDGSMLQVFYDGEPVYIVFSGDEMVATHPVLDVPFQTLIQRADLSRRVRPNDRRRRRLPVPHRPR